MMVYLFSLHGLARTERLNDVTCVAMMTGICPDLQLLHFVFSIFEQLIQALVLSPSVFCEMDDKADGYCVDFFKSEYLMCDLLFLSKITHYSFY